ncbi:MAG: NAD(P)/FAD-dependent oxidoreductase, partial [Bacteroidales bacterium]|nr:NAD(P)/FAD-dependent oxidoreductase [Bacteroidales bacterium]
MKGDCIQILVIGAGPAGMMAAIKAAESGAEVAVLEKNHLCGRKLAITGKGRCNITNTKPWAEFATHVHPRSNFV